MIHCFNTGDLERLFTKKSISEKGTLYQLRNLLNRSAVPADLGDNMKASEDFLLVVLHAHIVAAAKTICTDFEKTDLSSLSKAIDDRFIKVNMPSASAAPAKKTDADGVCMYAMEVLTLGLLWHNFHDSTREGDGERIIRNWKFNLLAYKAAKRKNYSIEALNLLLQVNHLLSPREAAQVKWCRCINTSGRQGCNVPKDLHLEHLNRRLKSALRNMGSNITQNSVRMAAESIGVVDHICHNFEMESTEHAANSDRHESPSFDRDYKLILSVLQEEEVFVSKRRRQHTSFKFQNSLLQQPRYTDIVKWIKSTTDTIINK